MIHSYQLRNVKAHMIKQWLVFCFGLIIFLVFKWSILLNVLVQKFTIPLVKFVCLFRKNWVFWRFLNLDWNLGVKFFFYQKVAALLFWRRNFWGLGFWLLIFEILSLQLSNENLAWFFRNVITDSCNAFFLNFLKHWLLLLNPPL